MIQEQLFISELFKDIQCNLIDLSKQDNVVIPSIFFQHIGCAFNLHSVINSGLILGGQSSSKRQTVFYLSVDLLDKSHKDPKVIDLNVPRHAQHLHNAWKKHQKTEYWVDINLAFTRTDKHSAYCIPKVVNVKSGEV